MERSTTICGIAGIIKFGNVSINEETIALLLVDNEKRGNDASGIMLQQEDGSIDIFKKDVPGWTLVKTKEYEDFIREKLKPSTRGALVHARGASQGNPRDNNNNHPLFAGKGAIIHNGVIRNDSIIFASLNLERKAETDSDAIRAIVDEYGITKKTCEVFSKMAGSGAICAIHPRYPGKVLLARSGNPLVLASNEDFLFFSSEKDTLHKACRPWLKRFGIWFQANKPNVDFSVMVDDSVWIIGLGGLEYHGICKINTGGFREQCRKTYETYEERSKRWNETKSFQKSPIGQVDVDMKLSACVCGKKWVIPKDELFSNFTCNKKKGGCGGILHDAAMKVN